ncbi:hypothetical protein [Rathayibacter tanaceti]|uniref:Uncharacterized protein n=2 Tax=Rathayibacter tanaceti TaxID=1671680 RepID=A0A162GQA6_9MICO|nr:hypothetical protein [Rathayibacter tanaceti]KZX21108.1 hypothetical protein ACH61_01764 [Rathayibacter tanaceti]QHC56675.1 hypothetical protein GSU10_14265 [Rathayibacter tanaceti]TCO36174.1 hypothetical protein EV639_10839 [Rathayibacter tanaceti]
MTVDVGGVTKDIVFTRDDTLDVRIDDAYRATSGIGSGVRAITSGLVTGTTLRVDPDRRPPRSLGRIPWPCGIVARIGGRCAIRLWCQERSRSTLARSSPDGVLP